MPHLPTHSATRKSLPVYSGVLAYFPKAIAAVAELSRIGNDHHNPGEPLRWDRSKSGDEKDALTRHLLEAGEIDHDGVRHSTKVAWRALANLEKELERAVEAPANVDAGVEFMGVDGSHIRETVYNYLGREGDRCNCTTIGPRDRVGHWHGLTCPMNYPPKLLRTRKPFK